MAPKAKSKTSWREKLEGEREPRVVRTPPKMAKGLAKGTMLIPRPLDVDALIRTVRKGKVVTVTQLRERLAEDHGADTTCPLTTGIFIKVAAEAAEEDRANGKKRITPYWRVVKADGGMNEKFPGGATAQARRLREEGLRVERARGKRPPRLVDIEGRKQKL